MSDDLPASSSLDASRQIEYYYSSDDFSVSDSTIRDGSATFAVSQIVRVDLRRVESGFDNLPKSLTKFIGILLVGFSGILLWATIPDLPGMDRWGKVFVLEVIIGIFLLGIFSYFMKESRWVLTVAMADGHVVVKKVKIMSGHYDYKADFQKMKESVETAMRGCSRWSSPGLFVTERSHDKCGGDGGNN